MRSAFAIVFSLLLVIGQWTSAMPSDSQRLAGACDACSCQIVSCCVAPAPAPTSNTPSAPAPSTRVTEQQLIAAWDTAAILLMSPIPAAKVSAPVHTADFATSSVPLYCWNCTLLI